MNVNNIAHIPFRHVPPRDLKLALQQCEAHHVTRPNTANCHVNNYMR